MAKARTATIDAAKQAIESPLLETSIQGATGVLYNISGGKNLTLLETSEAAEIIRAAVDEDAEIIYGTSIDEITGRRGQDHTDCDRIRRSRVVSAIRRRRGRARRPGNRSRSIS